MNPGVQHLRLVGGRAERHHGHRPQGLPAPCLHPLSTNRYRATLLSSALWPITVAVIHTNGPPGARPDCHRGIFSR